MAYDYESAFADGLVDVLARTAQHKTCVDAIRRLHDEFLASAPQMKLSYETSPSADCFVKVSGKRTIVVWTTSTQLSYNLYGHDGVLFSVPFIFADVDKIVAYVKTLAETD